MQRVAVLCVTIIFLLPAFAETKAHQSNPEQALDIGSRRELFVDHFLIDRLVGTRLELHHPQPAEVAIQVDRPWEGGDNLGISVLHHDGIYRMYYRGMANDDIKGRCLAESRDGITWTKPNLGLIEVAGTRDNNAIVEGKDTWSYFMIPFIDQRPGVPASHRIKGITPGFSRRGNFERRELFLHLSADGARWEKAQDDPILVTTFPNAFDSLVCLFWSAAEQRYVLYSRYMVDTQGRPSRKGGLRSVFRSTSPDLIHWSEPTPMTFTGTGVVPSAQLYTSMTEPYFRAPHIYVSFPMRFMENRKTVSDSQAQRVGLRPGRNADSSDGVFMSSRAGSTHFDWIFKEAFLRPGPGWENWGTRSNIVLWGLLPTVPGEMSLWVNRHYGTPSFHIRRYRLRTDGFVSVRAPYEGGEMLTKLFRFQGTQLEINYSTSAAGSIRVGIQDSAGKPIPGFGVEQCPEIIGDEITRVVSWKDGADVGALAGQTVRLRFSLKDADLYSIRFK